MDISQLYQLLGLCSGTGSSYGLYGGNYGSYGNYGQSSFVQVLKSTAVKTLGTESEDLCKMFVQLMQIQMQQKLQSILDVDEDDSSSASTFL